MFPSLFYTQQEKTRRKKFTNAEDELLIDVVDELGAHNWNDVAKYIPGRTGRQCRDRYINYLMPGIDTSEWTASEEETLRKQYEKFGPQWSLIKQYLPKRNSNAIKNKWNNYLKNESSSNDQSSNEETRIEVNKASTMSEMIAQETIDIWADFPPSIENWDQRNMSKVAEKCM